MRSSPPPDSSGVYGRLPQDAPRDLSATLDYLSQAALAGLPQIDIFPMTVDRNRLSAVRVFGKSLHMLTAGWVATILWLWAAGIRQHLLREGAAPPDFGLPFLLFGLFAGVLLGGCALYVTLKTGAAPHRAVERQEWHHAFWWSVFPNAMLLMTAYLMIASAY